MSKAILYDSTLCIGCKACESACAERWGLPYNEKIAAEERISAHKLTAVETHGERYSRRLCMNCQQPACASVCPVGAIQKTSLGPVVYDADKCMGCRYCMQACPVQVPSYEWDELLAEARERMTEKPDGYFNRVYGVQEVGGTSVLYLSAVPFEQIGLRTKLPMEALPETTWRVLELVPDVVSTGTVMLGGIWWITNRRAEVARKEGRRR